MHERRGPTSGAVHAFLLTGFAVACIGGPLALPGFLPGVAGDGVGSAGLVVALSLAVFAVPLAVWLAFSGRVVTGGGLTAFVEAAVGRRAAVAHGWIWALAYFLYLPYTITFVVYDLLEPVFPGVHDYRAALELLLPAAIVAFVFFPLRGVLGTLAVLGLAQVAVLVALAWIELRHAGAAFAPQPGLNDTGRAVGGTALLFVCASLPLYLGGEIRGGSRTMRRALVAAVALVGAAFLVSAIPLAAVPEPLRDAAVPGAAIARAYSGRGLEVTVGILTAAGTLALVAAEYLALARLLRWLHGIPLRTSYAWIGLPFIALDAISLLDPDRFYDDLLKPSLGALFVAQLAVFAVFPRFRRGVPALGAAAVASGLAAWGLYTLLFGASAT